MASIDWKKVPSLSEAKAIIRHNDYEERTKEGRQHSNTEIDKSKSSQNTSINGLSYIPNTRIEQSGDVGKEKAVALAAVFSFFSKV